jgi:hypothetical protein
MIPFRAAQERNTEMLRAQLTSAAVLAEWLLAIRYAAERWVIGRQLVDSW